MNLLAPVPPVTVTDNIPLQIGSVILAVASLVLIGFILHYDKKLLGWFVAPILWLIHGIVFYAVIFLDRYTTLDIVAPFGGYTIWSSILRFQTYFTIVGMLITFLVVQIINKRRYGPK